jgi:soluble lytic murein transglycosylase-like protein
MDGIVKRLVIALYSACLTYFVFTAADAYGAEPIPRAAYNYRSTLIREARFIWGLNAPTATFGSQVHTESGWRPWARNPSRAVGLGQFMPATARSMAKRYADLSPAAPLSPQWSLRAMLRYDLEIYRMTRNGSLCQKMTATLIGYNYGPSRMYRKKLPKETRNYLTRIFAREPVYTANGFGLGSCH